MVVKVQVLPWVPFRRGVGAVQCTNYGDKQDGDSQPPDIPSLRHLQQLEEMQRCRITRLLNVSGDVLPHQQYGSAPGLRPPCERTSSSKTDAAVD